MIYVLIVIYNKKCNDSLSYKSIVRYHNQVNIIIFDNSEQDFENKRFCLENDIVYYSFNKNVGLSKAYNFVISNIKRSKNNYLVILDDDTVLNKNYIDKIIENKNNNKKVYVPIVKSNNKIISPANIKYNCRVTAIKNIEDINVKKMTAINSGMIIRTDVFNDILYNEKIFLDYVDHDFCRKLRKYNIEIEILESEITQSFSRDDVNQEMKKVIKRYKIYIKDIKEFCKINVISKLYYFINVLKLTFKYTYQYKSFKFLKLLLNKGYKDEK